MNEVAIVIDNAPGSSCTVTDPSLCISDAQARELAIAKMSEKYGAQITLEHGYDQYIDGLAHKWVFRYHIVGG